MSEKVKPFFDHIFKPFGIIPASRGTFPEHAKLWNKACASNGWRKRVLVDADMFADLPIVQKREGLWGLVDATPNLDWLFITEHPENIKKLWPFGWYDDQMTWPNIWLGVRVQNQHQANERVEWLLTIPTPNLFVYFDLHEDVDLEECGVIEADGPILATYSANVGWLIGAIDKKRKRDKSYLEVYASLKDQRMVVRNSIPLWIGAGENAAWPIPLDGEVYRQFPQGTQKEDGRE